MNRAVEKQVKKIILHEKIHLTLQQILREEGIELPSKKKGQLKVEQEQMIFKPPP